MTITSHHNEKLKEIRKLRQRRRVRDRAHRFVAEGEDLLAAADAAGWPALERFCAAGSGLTGVEVDAQLLASASGLASGTRALGVFQERWAAAPTGPLCVYLHGVGDPGNVGAVLRSAHAFGASCVALGPGSADPFSPKAVRASMGAIFHVPVVKATADALPGITIALEATAERSLLAIAHAPDEISLLIGAERTGLPAEVLAGVEQVASIPIATHSLNAAMAATIALYEVTRMAPV
ncbi:MAG: TrmH family RNA methyltransferase [Solirubrobacteraceae bacterium]